MSSVFSVEDLSDSFWAAPFPATGAAAAQGMSWNQSEWAVERLLEEVSPSASAISASSATGNAIDRSPLQSQRSISRAEGADGNDVLEIRKPRKDDLHNHNHAAPSDPSSSVLVDSDQVRAILKSKLDLACAAVALRASSSKPEGVSTQGINQTDAAKQSVQSGSPAQASSLAQSDLGASSVNILPISALQKKSNVQVRQATSGSSKEDSDDDELEGDTETTDNMDPADAKRARRMLSNRESARRSRRRKQEHMNELETQVGQLRVEHSSLLKRLSDMNQKYDEAAVDNRILKADIETLRAKVKMAEETVKRVTGINPLLLPRSNVPNVGMPYVSSPIDTSPVAPLPVQPNPNQFFNQPVPNVAGTTLPHQRLDNGFPNSTLVPPVVNPQSDVGGENVTEMPTSFQHAPTVEHLQKQIGPSGVQKNVSPPEASSGWSSGLTHAVGRNNQKK